MTFSIRTRGDDSDMRSLVFLLGRITGSLLLLGLILTISSCRCPTRYYCVEGCEEFVTDSYRIREGKLSILEMEGQEVPELPDDAMDEYIDVVCEDDVLVVAVYHPTRKDLMATMQTLSDTLGFRVRNGEVDIPDLDPVQVAGLTLEQAREKLQEKFREQISNIEVFIAYKDRLSRKVELMGLVGATSLPVDGKMRLYDCLSKARPAPNANLFMSYVLRQGCPLPVDLYRLVNKGDMSQNIVMKGGDKIFIAAPSDARIMVMGEVYRPMAIDVPYGFISLREALVVAGGIPFTGDRRCIQVIRGNLVNPKIYLLSWEHIIHLRNESLLLMPGDTVYISEKPITQWNRFISQLLPSLTSISTGWGVYRGVYE